MAGKLIIHGVITKIPTSVNVFLDKEKLGKVKNNETIEVPIEKDGTLHIKTGLTFPAKLEVKADGVTEIQIKYNNLVGKYDAEIIG